jgi:adenosylmethionine-8-amino-7-oxononanoate aminotransferase
MDVVRVSACNEYRDRAAGESQQQYTERLLGELEAAILQAGPEKIIGFCAETVVAQPPAQRRLRRVICKAFVGCVINTAFCISPMR